MKPCLFFVLLLASIGPAFSQATRNSASVKEIDAYATSIDKIMERRKVPDVVVADTSDYEVRKPKWKRFKSEEELDKFRETSETYTIANNWRSNGRIVASILTLFSPSGDWTHYVYHYFRPDGGLAKVRTELRTFQGDYIIIHDRRFDARGKLLKKTSQYLDLATKKPKKPAKYMLDDNSPIFRPNYYKRVSTLPFYSLTKDS